MEKVIKTEDFAGTQVLAPTAHNRCGKGGALETLRPPLPPHSFFWLSSARVARTGGPSYKLTGREDDSDEGHTQDSSPSEWGQNMPNFNSLVSLTG